MTRRDKLAAMAGSTARFLEVAPPSFGWFAWFVLTDPMGIVEKVSFCAVRGTFEISDIVKRKHVPVVDRSARIDCEHHQQWASPDRTSPGMFEAKLVFLSYPVNRLACLDFSALCRGTGDDGY